MDGEAQLAAAQISVIDTPLDHAHDEAMLLFVINYIYIYFFFFFFSHITQHSIQNITKQNNRHILNISRSNQKGGREGRTIKTQKSLLYTITYIQQKTLPSINGRRPGPTDSRRCTLTRHYLQESMDQIYFSTHVWSGLDWDKKSALAFFGPGGPHYQSKVLNSKMFTVFLKKSLLLTKPAFI